MSTDAERLERADAALRDAVRLADERHLAIYHAHRALGAALGLPFMPEGEDPTAKHWPKHRIEHEPDDEYGLQALVTMAVGRLSGRACSAILDDFHSCTLASGHGGRHEDERRSTTWGESEKTCDSRSRPMIGKGDTVVWRCSLAQGHPGLHHDPDHPPVGMNWPRELEDPRA